EKYLYYTGKVNSVTQTDGGVRVELEDESLILIAELKDGTPVVDTAKPQMGTTTIDDIKEGMEIKCLIPGDSPMTLSMPPVTGSVELVIIQGETGSSTVTTFDEELVNKDNTLKLNIGENTTIVDIQGSRRFYAAEDLKNAELAVFYSVTTKSIPAQTTPDLVIIIDNEQLRELEAAKTAAEATETTDGTATLEETAEETPAAVAEAAPVELTGVRALAEAAGFKVTWTANDKPVMLEKDTVKIEITVGTKTVMVNGEAMEMELETALTDGTIMVSNQLGQYLK
ncbi:MAG: stalk domain-containing protein, partial [Anaerotignaceae bacterium]